MKKRETRLLTKYNCQEKFKEQKTKAKRTHVGKELKEGLPLFILLYS